MADKLTVTARIMPDGRAFTVTGRPAETLLSLVEAGPRGITSLEAFQAGWAVRLAAYIHRLRSECGLVVETTREPHQGGSHGRYILHSPVDVTERSDAGGRTALAEAIGKALEIAGAPLPYGLEAPQNE